VHGWGTDENERIPRIEREGGGEGKEGNLIGRGIAD
jgi:hypothetical protein